MKKVARSIKTKIRDSQEKGSREKLIEELFNDFNRSRFQIYKMNFVRGIFFGLGSVLGGTVVIAIIITILSVLGENVPFMRDFFDGLRVLLQSAE